MDKTHLLSDKGSLGACNDDGMTFGARDYDGWFARVGAKWVCVGDIWVREVVVE